MKESVKVERMNEVRCTQPSGKGVEISLPSRVVGRRREELRAAVLSLPAPPSIILGFLHLFALHHGSCVTYCSYERPYSTVRSLQTRVRMVSLNLHGDRKEEWTHLIIQYG